jgi:hypothetical protein
MTHDPRRIQKKVDAGLTMEQAIEVLDREAAPRTEPAKAARRTPSKTKTQTSLCRRSNEATAAAGGQAQETGRSGRKTRDDRPNPKPNKGDTNL